MQLQGHIVEACIRSGRASPLLVNLLGVLVAIDREACTTVKSWLQNTRVALVTVAVKLLREAYCDRLASAVKRATDVDAVARELVRDLWPAVRSAADAHGKDDPKTAALIFGLVEVVIRGVPHLNARNPATQMLFQVRTISANGPPSKIPLNPDTSVIMGYLAQDTHRCL